MHRAKRQSRLLQCLFVAAVVFTVATLLMLSVALASTAGHGFDHIALTLPVFVFLVLLTASAGEWLQLEDPFVDATASRSTTSSRAPPASLPFP